MVKAVSTRARSMKVEEPLKITQLDPKFKFEVSRVPGGESIKHCFQCGKCTATCPVRRFDNTFKPTWILRATLLGLRELVLSSEVIWLCAYCYSCTEKCPQGVRFSDVIRAIRNLAIKNGHVHPFFKKQGWMIANFGRIFELEEEEFINEMRVDMGLPPLTPVDKKEISKILQRVREIEGK